MSYALTIQEKAYLHAIVTGENSVENVRCYLQEVLGACAKTTCPFVLVEENLSGPGLRLEEIFTVASIDGMEVLPFVHYIAYVDTNPEHIASRMQFMPAPLPAATV